MYLKIFLLTSISFFITKESLTQSMHFPAKRDKDFAKEAIVALKEGYLFVRLKLVEAQVEKIRASGDDKKANRVIKEAEIINQRMIKEFDDHFNFCEYYFFKSNDIKSILEGRYEQVEFVGHQPDSLDKDRTAFVAVRGRVFEESQYNTLPKQGMTIRGTYNGKLTYLPRPFPSNPKLLTAIFSKVSHDGWLAVYQVELEKFYRKATNSKTKD